MIRVEKLSYGFPAKDLYKDISFSIEAGQHYVLIGSNGTGKSTLVDILINPEKYFFDGTVARAEDCRIGYASQFSLREKEQDQTVVEYLSQPFVNNQKEIARLCDEMAETDDLEGVFAEYQKLLDLNEAMDGDNYESNISKELNVAGMSGLADNKLSQISGGEYKLIQIMREMLFSPNLLVLDEPDVFLDFGNLGSLCKLINDYKGTLLVITHNRYLLNHCFDKVLHLENCDLQEFEGSYGDYRLTQIQEKLALKIQAAEEQEEIQRTEEMVAILRKRATLMVNPTIGRSVNAKQTQLDRLLARQIKAPFIEVREPEIVLPQIPHMEDEGEHIVLKVKDYEVAFDSSLLNKVSFEIKRGEKVAIVGANGTGKTTLVKDIIENKNPAISMKADVEYEALSQLQGDTEESEKTVREFMEDHGVFGTDEIRSYLRSYCLEWVDHDQTVGQLSVGEQNMLQIAAIAKSNGEFLILDEPTSHLDIYSQMAVERAISQYKGTVLMVSHDFYLVASCADYVLLLEDGSLRPMRARKFRKMVYDKYFDSDYLISDRKKQELEEEITKAFKNEDLKAVAKLCEQLG